MGTANLQSISQLRISTLHSEISLMLKSHLCDFKVNVLINGL